MIYRILSLAVWLAAGSVVQSQDVSFVRGEVKALADSSFKGRGYVGNGSELAAQYIAQRFADLGVEPPAEGRFQTFPLEVNTFPQKTTVAWGSDTLTEGYDYLIDPRSRSTHGRYATLSLDSSDFMSDTPPPLPDTHRVAVIDTRGLSSVDGRAKLHAYTQAALQTSPVVWLRSEKLMWSVGEATFDRALIEIDRTAVSSTVPDSLYLEVKTATRNFDAKNVMGRIRGFNTDSVIVITAHYDHLGMMGDAMFRGASDNATGTAVMLDLARHYIHNPPMYDTWFIAFAAEEAGLRGSRYFVGHPPVDLQRIKMVVNLDLLGSAAKGIAVVNGKAYPDAMATLGTLNRELDTGMNIKVRGNAANSDHYPFTQVGVPAVFIYTEGNIRAYHDVHDIPEVVDWANYREVFTLLVAFIETL